MVSNVLSSPQPQSIPSTRSARPSAKASPEGTGKLKSAAKADSFNGTKFQGRKQAKFGSAGKAVLYGGGGFAASAALCWPLAAGAGLLGLLIHPLLPVSLALGVAPLALGALGLFMGAKSKKD